MGLPKRDPGDCTWCAAPIPKTYRADRRTCSDKCRGAYHRAGNPRRHLSWRYGITTEDYQRMADKQGGACVICGTVTRLVVDHCHATGRIRGLLCDPCNQGLGKFRDNPATLRRAADYL